MQRTVYRFKLNKDLEMNVDNGQVYVEGPYIVSVHSGGPVVKLAELGKVLVPASGKDKVMLFTWLNRDVKMEAMRTKLLRAYKKYVTSQSKKLKTELQELTKLKKDITEKLKSNDQEETW